jgi:hypothetical protein
MVVGDGMGRKARCREEGRPGENRLTVLGTRGQEVRPYPETDLACGTRWGRQEIRSTTAARGNLIARSQSTHRSDEAG